MSTMLSWVMTRSPELHHLRHHGLCSPPIVLILFYRSLEYLSYSLLLLLRRCLTRLHCLRKLVHLPLQSAKLRHHHHRTSAELHRFKYLLRLRFVIRQAL